jgi:hypothetical protein
MGEDFDNHRRIFDGGDALQAAAAVRAVLMSMSKTRLSSLAQLRRAGA